MSLCKRMRSETLQTRPLLSLPRCPTPPPPFLTTPAMQHLPLSLAASKDPKDAPLKRQLAQIGALVAKSSKVVVVTGAGISCSCGIPVSPPPCFCSPSTTPLLRAIVCILQIGGQ